MPWSFNIRDLSAIASTIANLLLWVTTWRTLKLLSAQVNHQIASSDSLAQYQIVDAHRDLFLSILNNPALLESFAKANQLDPNVWGLQKMADFLINQVLVAYLNFTNGLISFTQFEGFQRDAQSLFAYPLVRERWHHTRAVHSAEFRNFVETKLLWKEVPEV
jgi:hypothetical protein